MNREYDRLFGYDDGRIVAIAHHLGGDKWNVWNCRSVGYRSALLDSVGCLSEGAAREFIKRDIRANRVCLRRGSSPRPTAVQTFGLIGGKPETEAAHWDFEADFCGLRK